MIDPQLAELESYYSWMDEQDRIEAVRFNAAQDRLETGPRAVSCGRCSWQGRTSTHYHDQKQQLRARPCPRCHRKNPNWRIHA